MVQPTVTFEQYMRIYEAYGSIYDSNYTEHAARRIAENKPSQVEVIREIVHEVEIEKAPSLSPEEVEAFRNLRMNMQPYVEIAQKSAEIELENLEKEEDKDILLKQVSDLLDAVDRKQELITEAHKMLTAQKEHIKKEEQKNKELSVQLEEEKAKLKKIVTDTISSEQEIEKELERES